MKKWTIRKPDLDKSTEMGNPCLLRYLPPAQRWLGDLTTVPSGAGAKLRPREDGVLHSSAKKKCTTEYSSKVTSKNVIEKLDHQDGEFENLEAENPSNGPMSMLASSHQPLHAGHLLESRWGLPIFTPLQKKNRKLCKSLLVFFLVFLVRQLDLLNAPRA